MNSLSIHKKEDTVGHIFSKLKRETTYHPNMQRDHHSTIHLQGRHPTCVSETGARESSAWPSPPGCNAAGLIYWPETEAVTCDS